MINNEFYKRNNKTIYNGDCIDILKHITIPRDAGWIIDPPWDSNIYLAPKKNMIIFTDCFRMGDVVSHYGSPTWVFVWDCVSSWYTPNRPLRRAKLALWYGNINNYDGNNAYFPVTQAPTTKTISNTRGTYQYTSQDGGRRLTDVFVLPITAMHKKHPHQKPFDWCRVLIFNCFSACSMIIDPFMGSGIIATCSDLPYVGIEISLEYCQMAVDIIEGNKHVDKMPVQIKLNI